MDMVFTVDSGDCDHFGFIRYRRYLDWIHETRVASMAEMGAGDDLLTSKGIDMVTVNLHLRNLEACRAGDRIEVVPCLDKVMSHALYFTFTGRNADTRTVIFIAQTEMYPISREGNLVRLPPEIVDTLTTRIGS